MAAITILVPFGQGAAVLAETKAQQITDEALTFADTLIIEEEDEFGGPSVLLGTAEIVGLQKIHAWNRGGVYALRIGGKMLRGPSLESLAVDNGYADFDAFAAGLLLTTPPASVTTGMVTWTNFTP